jgi:hypothetical protein
MEQNPIIKQYYSTPTFLISPLLRAVPIITDPLERREVAEI